MKKYLLVIAFASLTSVMFAAQTTPQTSTPTKTEKHAKSSTASEPKKEKGVKHHKKGSTKKHHHKNAGKKAKKSSKASATK